MVDYKRKRALKEITKLVKKDAKQLAKLEEAKVTTSKVTEKLQKSTQSCIKEEKERERKLKNIIGTTEL